MQKVGENSAFLRVFGLFFGRNSAHFGADSQPIVVYILLLNDTKSGRGSEAWG